MNTERRLIALVLVVAALGAGPALQPDELRKPSIRFAVLRRDGILIPFATFDGTWKNFWPEPLASPVVPITLDSVPKKWWPGDRPQTEWTLWLPTGESRPLTVTAPVWYRAQCLAGIGLRTDFAPAPGLPPPDVTPYPKEGLATAVWGGPEREIEPITVLENDDQDWRLVQAMVAPHVQKAEEDAIRGEGGAWRRQYREADRARHPLTLEALYRVPDQTPGSFIYYFEAAKRYPDLSTDKAIDPPCDILTYSAGWLRLRADGSIAVSARAAMTNCYRWNVNFVWPLGVFRLTSGRPIWILQSSSWSGEAYVVVDLAEPARQVTLVQTSGGWCR
jgi:hypothetical protein